MDTLSVCHLTPHSVLRNTLPFFFIGRGKPGSQIMLFLTYGVLRYGVPIIPMPFAIHLPLWTFAGSCKSRAVPLYVVYIPALRAYEALARYYYIGHGALTYISYRSTEYNHMSNAIISLPGFTKCCDKKNPRLRNTADVTGNHCIILDPR